ncbi:hypothetical protein SRABI96_03646 [Peribacillus sp. Bi96]|nr:hypothetical protein [Peribacillus sp. Bi96]CAH0269343.1 hypothetical protein SRABI96_03646 [Peribacillus sp. Bi96]
MGSIMSEIIHDASYLDGKNSESLIDTSFLSKLSGIHTTVASS